MVMSAAALIIADLSATDLYKAIHGQKGFAANVVHSLCGVTVNFRAGNGDTLAGDKIVGVRSAISKVAVKGLGMPNTINVYTSADTGFVNVAFQRAIGGGREASIGLGGKLGNPMSLPVGMATVHGLGSTSKYVAAVCVHEIGHILHEMADEAFFWSAAANALTPGPLGGQVSMYAGNNVKEFVAEVFTGLIFGDVFSLAVMQAYRGYSGPTVVGGFGTNP